MSNIITIIIENVLPSAKEKYVYHHYKQLSVHHPFKESIPAYLHDRPHGIITHCLDRKLKGFKFTASSVHDIHPEKGVFEIERSSGRQHRVDFGNDHIPCKHFLCSVP